MPRTRSILIDNTLGKIFTNVGSSASTDSSKLIAGTKLQSYTYSAASRSTTVVARNIGVTRGVPFPNNGLIVSGTLSVSSLATGRAIIVDIKVGSIYATSTVAGTISLPINTVTALTNLAISVQSGQFLFFDVTQVGNIRPGTGLSIKLDYFTG